MAQAECVNAQELFCFLVDCVLYEPQADEWESFKSAIHCWVDCWFDGANPEFTTSDDNTLEVRLPEQNDPIIVLNWQPDEGFPLSIQVQDDGELDGDSYNIHLYTK